MDSVLHLAQERGFTEDGQLQSHQSFCFFKFQDPKRKGFGALHVLNDERMEAGFEMPMHPHEDQEIVMIVLSGRVEHVDSLGNDVIIDANTVQCMSCGSGMQHLERNPDETPAQMILAWFKPNEKGLDPHYKYRYFAPENRDNRFSVLVAKKVEEGSLRINQSVRILRGSFNAQKRVNYEVQNKGHGVYLMVLEGEIRVGDALLKERDAVGLTEMNKIEIEVIAKSDLLLFEVDMV